MFNLKTLIWNLVRLDEVLGFPLISVKFGRRDGERVQDGGELALVERQLIWKWPQKKHLAGIIY